MSANVLSQWTFVRKYKKEEWADSHLFITVLAYPFVRIIRRQLKENDKDFSSSWHTL